MKKYQARKALSVLLTVLMLLSSVYLGLGVIASALTSANLPASTTSLADGTVYLVTGNQTIDPSKVLTIPANATVFIQIAAGASLTVTGSDANGTTAGKAAIKMNQNSKLIFIGSGALTVKGGKGANGGNGSNNSGTSGGNGGAGGAGGGAGIGTDGGNVGTAAGAWPTGASVIIADTVGAFITNGDNGTAGSNGTQSNSSSAGGYGGGGGYGAGGAAIGTGGGGGSNGTKGSNGSTACGGSKGNNGTEGSDGSRTAEDKYSETTAFSVMQATLASNAATLALSQGEQLELGYDALNAAYTPINNARDAVNNLASGSGVFAFFFGSYSDAIAQLESSMLIVQYKPIVDNINAYITTDYSEYTKDQLVALYENLNTSYTSYKALNNPTVYNYFEVGNPPILNRAVVDEELDKILNAQEIAVLRDEVKPAIEAELATIADYDQDWVLATDNADVTLNAAKTALTGYETALGTYKATNVTAVFGENYVATVFGPVREKLNKLLIDNDYKVQFAQYKSVYSQAFENISLSTSTDDLYAVLSARDGWYTDLQNYIASIEAYDPALAEKIMATTGTAMQNKIDTVYAMLNTRVEAQINNAYDQYMAFVAEYGYTINTSDDVNVRNYNDLRTTFSQLNPQHYEFLLNTTHFDVSEETVAKYDAIKNALFAFDNYDVTKGLSAYAFNAEKATDILREVSVYDRVRNQNYTVDEVKRATAYSNVKKLLDSDLVKESLGFDLNKTISDLINGLPEKIYTDEFLNTLIKFVYPVVAKEFAKVWADLPSTYPLTDPVETTLTLKIDDLHTALGSGKIDLPLLPDLLALKLGDSFPEAKAALARVPATVSFDKPNDEWIVNPWENENIYDSETEKLTLVWGITDKASFLAAASVALKGVEPLLLALLSNKTHAVTDKKVGTGSGSYACVDIKVDPINLNMTFTGNPGYNNAIAPVLSALGANDLPDGSDTAMQNTRAVLESGLINPIHSILETIKANPLDAILDLLPSLAFALNHGLLNNALGELKTIIDYKAIAKYDAGIGGSGEKEALADSIDINLLNMLDLTSMGIDITSPAALVNSLIGLLSKSDEAETTNQEEPTEPSGLAAILAKLDIDEMFKKIAYLGTGVDWQDGYRTESPFNWPGHEADFPRIIANRPEIFAYLVQNILSILDKDLVNELMIALAGKDDQGNPNPPQELPEIVDTIIDNIANNPDDAIAAIVELMVPQTYDNYAELETPADSFTYNENEITPANIAYLKYANDWDKDTATAIANNVDELIPTIAGLLGKNISLNETLQNALNGVFTGENLTKVNNLIAGAVAGLAGGDDAGDGEEEAGGLDILGLLKDELGIDLAAFQEVPEDYDWGITDGDKAAFVNKLCGILNPLAPVLKLVAPGKDLSILDGIVNVKGYDVYPKSFGLIFDALGIDQITGYENKTASEELEMILNALLAWVDDLTAEGNSMIKDVLELLPDLVYFIESNGLSVAIKNLIYPIQILLDTIYPIYPIDLMELIGGLAGGDDEEEPSGIAAILANLDLDNLKMSTILPIVDDMLGTELVRSPLATYAIPALTIKHGDLDAADVLTILLCGVIEAFEAKILDGANAGKTNGDVILAMIDNEQVTDIYTKIVPLVTGGESAVDPDKITPINWTYMMGDDYVIELADFAMPAYSNEAVINYLSTYEKNQWTAELAEYLNDNLDSIVKDVLKVAGQDENYLATLISGLLNDKLYTADVVNAAGNAIYDLLGNLEDQLKVVVDALLGTEIAGKTYTEVTSVNGKADFIAKMKDILNPFNRILGFVLFGQSYKFFNGTTREDLLVLTGGDAYNAALVPVLEALGVNAPVYDSETDSTGGMIDKILTAVTNRLDEIAADPINKILDLLPNVLYFLNADGVKAIINNAVLPFDALVEAVTGNDAATLLAGVEVKGVALNDLNTENILDLIGGLANIQIPAGVKSAVSSFYIGKAVYVESANGKPSFKLVYDGDRKDMITILASVLIEVLAYEDNASILKGVSEEAYQVVLNILGKSDEEISVPMKVPEWLYPEAANTGKTFSAINTSTEFGAYGPLFTQEMAIYLADNLDDFIDNLIYLLGIPADSLEGLGIHSSTDEYITSLKDLLNTVIGDTVYTTDIADMLLNLVEDKLVKTVNELTINGVNMSGIVKNVLKTALKVDLDRYTNGTEFTKDADGKYHVQPFAKGSKEGFLNALTQILDPVYPVLNWLLCEEDLHFFTDSNGDHQITLKGGQGYKYGIIPILETFDCTSLPTQAAVSATTDTASLVNTIATPLLSRIDKLLENPVDEIFELLPNVAYFINSKGLDACVRNMTNAINVVLKALQPLVGDVDLFAAIGIDLSTLDMQYILNAITNMIGEGSTQDLVPLVVDALAELTTGKIVTSSSQSELTPWYKMEYAGETSKADTITTLLRFALRWVALNKDQLKNLVREKIEMSDEGYAYIDKLIDIVGAYAGTNSGMDSILHMLYYIFYGVHSGTTKVANWQRDYNTRLQLVAEGEQKASARDENLGKVAELLDFLFTEYVGGDKDDTGNVYHNYPDSEYGNNSKPGFASNGFIAFFQQIINWIKTIINKVFHR